MRMKEQEHNTETRDQLVPLNKRYNLERLRAAHDAFLAGASEAEIHRAYLVAAGHTDRDLPYTNIVCLNEHAAVLHYQYQDEQRPVESRSFLIDAGASVNGYASDITRTWVNTRAAGQEEFAELLAAMEREQLGLVAEVRALRVQLGITQTQAAQIFGGGPVAFVGLITN